jgi:2-oxoglutarate dehydrogenase E2 component (dihydrolipoamide succinyltransferase)
MALVELLMPKMGESIMEATILSWLKKPGDKIELEESLLEVATDKVDTEVPSTHGGILKEILAQKGDVVKVGYPIAVILTEGNDSITTPAVESSPLPEKKIVTPGHTNGNGKLQTNEPKDTRISARFYSPLVKNIVKQENISLSELENLPGSGKEGRVTKNDIIAYVQHRGTKSLPGVSAGMTDEILEMDRMRKIIAERMIESRRISAHVTSFVEADVSNLVHWRNQVKHNFFERTGEALTYTPLFIEAVALAIRDYPMINIQVDGNKIIRKKDINIGMAVALPTGNLIVPVVRNADQLSLAELTKIVNDFARRARENKLKPDDLAGGTFTISNIGSFGNIMGTPIIMQPQVAILALGAMQKKPSVIETPGGDAIAIRHKMFLSHSYDHRVVDGALGGMLVKRVSDNLERFDIHRTI